ncbi:MAG: hypothetical protein EOM62_14245 [Bacteroidia bacterium]|nr:hypothetical protein [Bacteroidia bacterium]
MKVHKNNIAIIGHGPSTRGRKLGAFIDLCDIVVRMIECDWQDQEDYGSKYTIGIYATGGSDDFTKIIQRKPSLCWWIYVASGAHPPTALMEDTVDMPVVGGRPVRWLRNTVWDWIGTDKKFSRGTAAAIASMTLLQPTALHLVGFDDVVRGGMMKDAYHPPELRQYLREQGRTLARSETDHDWKNEGMVLQKAAEHYGIEVNFA